MRVNEQDKWTMVETSEAKPRAADQLIAYFEDRILDGTFPPGEPLPPEREIVQAQGVSRTVVREALRALAGMGLVTARPGFRPVVARPGYDEAIGVMNAIVAQLLGQPNGVRNLFDVRIRMEASLVREAAVEASAADLDRLEQALEANRLAINDTSRFYETDIAFHAVLYEIPGNPALPAIHRAYTEWLSVHWKKMPRMPKRNEMNFEAHRAIFEAILRRDPDRAEKALREHLDFAWKQVSSTFEDTPS